MLLRLYFFIHTFHVLKIEVEGRMNPWGTFRQIFGGAGKLSGCGD
jgi:hypothetical protein